MEAHLEDYTDVSAINKSIKNLEEQLGALVEHIADIEDDHTDDFEQIVEEMMRICVYTGFVKKPGAEEQKGGEDAEVAKQERLRNSTFLEVLENPAFDLISEVHRAIFEAIHKSAIPNVHIGDISSQHMYIFFKSGKNH